MPKNITFRTHLLGSVAEFCQNSGLVTLQDSLTIVDLVVGLARYQEEGCRECPIGRANQREPGGVGLQFMNTKTHPDLGLMPIHWDVVDIGDVADVTKLAGYEFTKHIEYIEEGEIVVCPDCGTEFEVISLDPVEIEEAPEVEEDWGE